jgi:hypothetical protein
MLSLFLVYLLTLVASLFDEVLVIIDIRVGV